MYARWYACILMVFPMDLYMCTCCSVYMWVCVNDYMCTYAHVYVMCMCACTQVCMHMLMQVYKYYMFVHICTHESAEVEYAGYAQGVGWIRSAVGRIRSGNWPDTLRWSRIRSDEPERMRPKNQRFFFEFGRMSAAEWPPERIRLGRIRSVRKSWERRAGPGQARHAWIQACIHAWIHA